MSLTLDTAIHLFAGGFAGIAGTIVTNPLEVVKTRLQSSKGILGEAHSRHVGPSSSVTPNTTRKALSNIGRLARYDVSAKILASQRPIYTVLVGHSAATVVEPRLSLIECTRHVFYTEGIPGFFKGLAPSVLGIAPSRAIYFAAYSNTKSAQCVTSLLGHNTPALHLFSAGCAGFINTTITNPIWVLRTRLQLDQKSGIERMTMAKCIEKCYAEGGLRIFMKGVTASYVGVGETMFHFMMYENFKSVTTSWFVDRNFGKSSGLTYAAIMCSGAMSKFIAGTTFYPHEVARTRLREANSKYRGFFHCLLLIKQEEGLRGWYRGLGIHLLRQVPNTAITLAAYEFCLYVLKNYF